MSEQAILEEEIEETQEIEFPREKLQANAALKVSSVDEDSRTVVAVISSASVDRDKEVLLPKGANFDNYLKNPVVLWGHQSSDPPIGKALWVKRGQKQITAKVKFATTERGEEIWELFKGGYLNAFSVGFIPLKGHQPTPDEIRKMPEWAEARFVYDEWELLEFSPVTVPANPDALRLALESGKVKICKEVKKEMAIEDVKEPAEEVLSVSIPVDMFKVNADPVLSIETVADNVEIYTDPDAGKRNLGEQIKKLKGIVY